ncbi:MAG TPA: phosphotransferase [Flexivirga sp.]|uniref:phosphotransferase n=1 Tax=Flexivirga sp. TaxID=1962927 RepID=UPI002C9C79A3|nr:phosphotransferase [Flexivirga sp.]HWC22044.1 phosphotransferase [Flexivirga sp.]
MSTCDHPGVLLATGATALVYELDDRRVLRRYRDRRRPVDRAANATEIAWAAGIPTPRVLAAHGPDLVLERVDGPTMLAEMSAGRLSMDDAMRLLADLHRMTHAVRRPDDASLLPERDGGDRLIHLDLHPNNVLMAPGAPVLIDWENACWGPPGLDVAVTAVILACYALAYRTEDDALDATDLLDVFLRAAEPLTHLDEAVAFRRDRVDFMPPAEAAQLDNAAGLVRYLADQPPQ